MAFPAKTRRLQQSMSSKLEDPRLRPTMKTHLRIAVSRPASFEPRIQSRLSQLGRKLERLYLRGREALLHALEKVSRSRGVGDLKNWDLWQLVTSTGRLIKHLFERRNSPGRGPGELARLTSRMALTRASLLMLCVLEARASSA